MGGAARGRGRKDAELPGAGLPPQQRRLGDGVYDTFTMIDETKCPPCSNTLCNPSEALLSRRLSQMTYIEYYKRFF
ncbi:hypothetical protein STEG23_034201 [Scotinomys teguina]